MEFRSDKSVGAMTEAQLRKDRIRSREFRRAREVWRKTDHCSKVERFTDCQRGEECSVVLDNVRCQCADDGIRWDGVVKQQFT